MDPCPRDGGAVTEAEGRASVVREALEWRYTPYHVGGRLKGVGVDCGTFLAEVYERAGIISHVEIQTYRGDEHLHSPEEEYLALILQFAHEIKPGTQKDGDVALWKFGKRLSHSGIIVGWPLIVHATRLEKKVWRCDVSQDQRYAKEPRFFSPW